MTFQEIQYLGQVVAVLGIFGSLVFVGLQIRQNTAIARAQVHQQPDGSTMKLRFTRYNVMPDRFESKMEISRNGGLTWVPGNHQVFLRSR